MTTTKTDTTSETQRAAATGVRLNIGLMSAEFDLAPARVPNLSKRGATSLVCLDGEKPARVEQYYICSDGHRHREGELGRAYIGTNGDSEKIVPLTPDDVVAIKCGDATDKNIDLTVHPADQVESSTVGDETFYRVRPPKKAGVKQREIYGLLSAMASDETYAIVGRLRLRDSVRLYRLRNFRGQLCLQSLVNPNDLAPNEDIDVPELNESLVAQGKLLVESMATDFDAAEYDRDIEAAMATIVEAREKDPVATGAAPAAAAATKSDIEDLLSASLDNVVKINKGRTKKPTTKRTAKRQPAKRTAKTG